jgi:hypothetical protein
VQPQAGQTAVTPANFFANQFVDAIPDPRYQYRYTVQATQANNCTGTALVTVAGPFPTPNPDYMDALRAGSDVQLRWRAMPGAVAYRIDGGNIPGTGLNVPGETFVPGTMPNPVGSQQSTPKGPMAMLGTSLHGLSPSAYNFSVVAMYPGNFADYTTPARSSVVATGGTYRITLNGFQCLKETFDDQLNRDGAHDEIYPAVFVHQIDRSTYTQKDAYYVKTPIYGEGQPRFQGRVSAGSGSSSGGIAPGDVVPNTAVPGARAGAVPPSVAKNGIQTLPVLVWQGTLTDKGDVLIVKPSLWEADDDHSPFSQWVNAQQQANLSTLWSQPAVQLALNGGTMPGNVAGGVSQTPLTLQNGLGVLVGGVDPVLMALGQILAASKDRPVGLYWNSGLQLQMRQPIIVLTRESIETSLSHDPAGPLRGIIPVEFADGASAPPYILNGIYKLFLQIERIS